MKLNIWSIVCLLLVAVILYMQFCRKNPTVIINPPQVKSVPEQQKVIVTDKQDNKVSVDSFQSIISLKDKLLTRTTNELLNGQDKVLELQQENDSLLSLLKSGEIKNELIVQAGKIKLQSFNNDSICNSALANLREQLKLHKGIHIKDSLFAKKLEANNDTCLSNQSKLQKFIKDTKQRNKFALGVVGNFYPDAGIGFSAAFINKRGLIINANVLRMNKNWYPSLGVLKVISFR